jgi:hypothetical protein
VTETPEYPKELVGQKPRLKITLDSHAQKRARERGVSEDEINDTLASYDTELPGDFGRKNRHKVIGEHRIRVTFHVEPDDNHYVWTVTKDEVVVK